MSIESSGPKMKVSCHVFMHQKPSKLHHFCQGTRHQTFALSNGPGEVGKETREGLPKNRVFWFFRHHSASYPKVVGVFFVLSLVCGRIKRYYINIYMCTWCTFYVYIYNCTCVLGQLIEIMNAVYRMYIATCKNLIFWNVSSVCRGRRTVPLLQGS